MNWSQDVILEFLILYKSEPCLWNPNHALNKNRTKKLESWAQIQESLSEKFEINEIKRKKECLMAQYRSCLHRKNKERRTGNTGYESTWFAYALMDSFLGTVYKTETNDYTEEDIIEFAEEDYDERVNITFDSPLTRKRARMLKAQDDPLDSETDLHNSVNYVTPTLNERRFREPDECELYGQLLALKLKKINEHQRSVVMNEIDNLVFNAVMKHQS